MTRDIWPAGRIGAATDSRGSSTRRPPPCRSGAPSVRTPVRWRSDSPVAVFETARPVESGACLSCSRSTATSGGALRARRSRLRPSKGNGRVCRTQRNSRTVRTGRPARRDRRSGPAARSARTSGRRPAARSSCGSTTPGCRRGRPSRSGRLQWANPSRRSPSVVAEHRPAHRPGRRRAGRCGTTSSVNRNVPGRSTSPRRRSSRGDLVPAVQVEPSGRSRPASRPSGPPAVPLEQRPRRACATSSEPPASTSPSTTAARRRRRAAGPSPRHDAQSAPAAASAPGSRPATSAAAPAARRPPPGTPTSGGNAMADRNRSGPRPLSTRTGRAVRRRPASGAIARRPDQERPDPGQQIEAPGRPGRPPAAFGPERRRAHRPPSLERERRPAVRGVPGQHRREHQQADGRPPGTAPAAATRPARPTVEHQVDAAPRPAGTRRGTCSAAPRPRPGPRPARAATAPAASSAAASRSSVSSQKNTSGPSGSANVPAATPK